MNECCFRKWTPAIEKKEAQQLIWAVKKKTPHADVCRHITHTLKEVCLQPSLDVRIDIKTDLTQ